MTTASVLVVGPDAVPAMRSFVTGPDGRGDLGWAEYVSAAIAYLGGGPPVAPSPETTASFEEPLGIATDLRSDFQARRRRRRTWSTWS
ncbi:hypothetical protein [Promicromonospora sukumoe]|uniref:hypothetical protein n=1 Tax=Promicromonospora sukumoe TaxID=88382 RepID=UPI0012FCE23A|nr:hypothetical protein [Promicromonospora sukumoe]